MTGPSEPYPLQAVETLRERDETSATEALARALKEVRALEEASAAALADLQRHQKRQSERQAARPEVQRTTAAAWTREELYRAQQREREAALEATLEAAAKAERDGRGRVSAARKALGGAATGRAVVAAHRERWQQGVERRREQKEEDEQDEWRRGSR